MSSLSFPAFYLALVPHQKESTATSPKKHISESREEKLMSKAKGKPATCKVKSFISFLLWETFFKFIFVGISSLSPKTLEKSDEKNTLQTFLYNRIGSVVLKWNQQKSGPFL